VDAQEEGYNWAPLEANDDFLEGSSVEEEEGEVRLSTSLRLSVKLSSSAPRERVPFPSGPA
jgi:hypothetical protein